MSPGESPTLGAETSELTNCLSDFPLSVLVEEKMPSFFLLLPLLPRETLKKGEKIGGGWEKSGGTSIQRALSEEAAAPRPEIPANSSYSPFFASNLQIFPHLILPFLRFLKKERKSFHFEEWNRDGRLHCIESKSATFIGRFLMRGTSLGRPLKGRNVPGCFIVISHRYIFEYFVVLTSFRTSFQGSKTGLHRKVLDFSSTLLWKPVSKPVFIYQKPVYTWKYLKIRRSEMAPQHPGMFRPLRGRPFHCAILGWKVTCPFHGFFLKSLRSLTRLFPEKL